MILGVEEGWLSRASAKAPRTPKAPPARLSRLSHRPGPPELVERLTEQDDRASTKAR
jgi:hypothetical protein